MWWAAAGIPTNLGVVARKEADVVDHAPLHGAGGEALARAAGDEGLAGGVGMAVVGLPHVAEEGGDGGEKRMTDRSQPLL